MQYTGNITDLSIDFRTGNGKVSLMLDTKNLADLEEIKDTKLNIELKKWYKKRSLDMNAYCWKLISLISEKENIDKEIIYKDLIKYTNTFTQLCLKTDAVETFKRVWQKNGLGYVVETYPSKLEGCTNIHAYYGSSSYDTKEMSKLIDIIIEECKQWNIETLTPAELNRLKEEWK